MCWIMDVNNEIDQRIRQLRAKIEILHDIKKLELLVEEAQKLLNLNPNDIYALYMMGLSYMNLGRLDEAENVALNYLALEPNDAQAHSLYASILSSKDNYERAIAEFEKAIELNPLDSHFYINLAINSFMLDNSKNLDKSITLVLKALELNPDDATAHSYLAEQYKNAGRLKDAERESLIALNLDPEPAIIHEQFGRLQIYLENFEKAEEHLLESLRLQPDNDVTQKELEKNTYFKKDITAYYCEMMRYYTEVGNINEAEAFALKYIKEYPNEGHAYYCYGKILYCYKNNAPEATKIFRKAIKLENSNGTEASAYHALASCIYDNSKSNIMESIELLKRALKISPDNIKIRSFLSDLYLCCANYGCAEKECLKLLELNQENPTILALWAKVQFYSANFNESKKYLDKTLELEPSNNISLSVLEAINNYQKNPQHFLRRLIRSYYFYIKKFPESEKDYLVLAKAYILTGSIKKAADSINKYLELRPNDSYELSSFLSQICDFGKKEEILELLIKLNKLYPNKKVIEQNIETISSQGITYKRKKMFGIF